MSLRFLVAFDFNIYIFFNILKNNSLTILTSLSLFNCADSGYGN